MKTNTSNHRGYAAVIAMILLVIGASLAAGFSTLLGSARSIASNHRSVLEASKAAESGVNFMVLKLQKVAPDAGLRTHDSALWMPPLTASLREELEATGNIPAGQPLTALPDGSLLVPAIKLPDSTSFQARVSPSVTTANAGLTLQVTGYSRSGSVTRTIAINLDSEPERQLDATRFIMAARDGIFRGGSSKVQGYDPKNGKADSRIGAFLQVGDNPDDPPKVVQLYTPPESLPDYREVASLAFPQTDVSFIDAVHTSALTKYAAPGRNKGNTATIVTNTYIPAGANPTFGDVELRGIIYVEWPNNLAFSGNTKLNGVIVYQPAPESEAGKSVITVAKSPTFTNTAAGTQAQLAAIPWLTDKQREALAEWSIIAPQTDLDISNGNATPKYFEGSLHIHSLLKLAGLGNADTGMVLNGAGMYAEGSIDMTGNRIFWVTPGPNDGGDANDYAVRALYVMQLTYSEYREPQTVAKEPS